MTFRKIVEDGYLVAVCNGNTGLPISDEEYTRILAVIQDKPPMTNNTDYRLREDLTWEPYEVAPVPESDPSPDELLDILMGGVET